LRYYNTDVSSLHVSVGFRQENTLTEQSNPEIIDLESDNPF